VPALGGHGGPPLQQKFEYLTTGTITTSLEKKGGAKSVVLKLIHFYIWIGFLMCRDLPVLGD